MGKRHTIICSKIAIIPPYTIHEIGIQYITFHPLYNIEGNTLLNFSKNAPYGGVGLTVNTSFVIPHQFSPEGDPKRSHVCRTILPSVWVLIRVISKKCLDQFSSNLLQ